MRLCNLAQTAAAGNAAQVCGVIHKGSIGVRKKKPGQSLRQKTPQPLAALMDVLTHLGVSGEPFAANCSSQVLPRRSPTRQRVIFSGFLFDKGTNKLL